MNPPVAQVFDNFVAGRPAPPADGSYARWENLVQIADSGERDVLDAVRAADEVLGFWSGLERSMRAQLLERAARRMILDAVDPFHTATLVAPLRYASDRGLYTPLRGGPLRPLAEVEPCVAKLIIPFGTDLGSLATRLAPLLISGHSLVIGVLHKACADQGAQTLRALARIGACLPDGVVNLVCGRAHNMGQALIQAPQARVRVLVRARDAEAPVRRNVRPD